MRLDPQDISEISESLRPIVRGEIRNALLEHAEALAKPEIWKDTDEIADHLGVGPHVIRDARQRKAIPCLKIGKQYRFQVSEVERVLRQCDDD